MKVGTAIDVELAMMVSRWRDIKVLMAKAYTSILVLVESSLAMGEGKGLLNFQ